MPTLHPNPPRIPPHLFSEREVLAALNTLPPEAHVFVRLAILDPDSNRDRELDFLVVHPELGLVIVEVKGHGVEPRGDHWVRIHPDGNVQHLEETPGEQLTQQQYRLLQFLKRANVGFVPPITRVLALPALPLRTGQHLGPDLPACRILTRDKLRQPFQALREAVAGGRPWEHWQGLEQAKPYHIPKDTLKALLGVLTPALLPPASLAELMAAEGEVQDQQAQFLLNHLAHNFSQGRYHVAGAPGSGKSLLARKVARLWAAEGRKVLMVSFNKALTCATQTAMDDLVRSRQAVVSTYHDLAVTLLDRAQALPPFSQGPDYYTVDLPTALAEHAPAIRERWDALVVDEAQDLEPAWVEQLLGLLQDPGRNPVLLLEDPAQSLFRETRHALGHPWRLELSLRQNVAIRRAAIQALPSCGWALPAEGPEPAEPGAVASQPCSPAAWKQELAGVLAGLQRDGLAASQVLILAPYRAATLGLRHGQSLGPWPLNAHTAWWEGEQAEQVRFGTVQGFKGLEADVVVYLAPDHPHQDAARLRYTALSRARHRVVILEDALADPGHPQDEPAAPPATGPAAEPAPLAEAAQAALMGALRSRPGGQPSPS